MKDTQSSIILKDICFKRDSTYILKDINFSAEKGTFTTIIGPNGAGKTTLIKIITGLLKPTSGQITVTECTTPCSRDNCSKISYVPQTKNIDTSLPFSIFDIILMGTINNKKLLSKISKEEREKALYAAELTQITNILNKPVGEVSGGQLQRAFIARALSQSCNILVLDEPIAGIDIGGTEAIHNLLKSLTTKGKTIIYVSHDLGLISRVTDTIACLNISLFAHGKPKEVLTGENLKKMYGTDMAYLYHNLPYALVGEHKD